MRSVALEQADRPASPARATVHVLSTETYQQAVAVMLLPGGEISEHAVNGDQVVIVLHGQVNAVVDGQQQILAADGVLGIAAGAAYRLRTAHDQPARLLVVLSPPRFDDTTDYHNWSEALAAATRATVLDLPSWWTARAEVS